MWEISLAGGVLILIGIFFLVRTWRFVQRAVDTEGTVVGMKSVSTSKGTGHSPIFQYQVDGRTYEVTESSSSSHPGVGVGDPVPVKYDPAKPDKGRLARPFNLWGLGGFLVLLGLIFAVVGPTVG